ncbi:MAG: FUSC family protein, partial [Planctomycetota bacterium]
MLADRVGWWPEPSAVKDAARLSVQTAVSAAAMYTLMRALGLPEIFVGVLSAVLIVQPSLGSTLGSGMRRVLATVVGCAIGVVTVLAIPYGYGTAGALAISMLVMNAVASFRPDWKYGVVAAVAISMSANENALQAAGFRALSIGIGVAVGILTSVVVWPEMASTRCERKLTETLHRL